MNISMRKKLCLFLASVVVIHFLFINAKSTDKANPSDAPVNTRVVEENAVVNSDKPAMNTLALYDTLNLADMGLSRQAYDYAVKGLQYLHSNGKLSNENIVSIVDFSQPSSKKRLYIIDLEKKKVLFNTYVSHGRNSGREMAKEFSNTAESFKSSLGFYVTGGTYTGKHGFSMRLMGEEKGINDNALNRAIVMHSAAYVSESAIKAQGFVGRSLGCPALPENMYKPVIETIKNGTCLFLYSPNNTYAANSTILKKIA